MIVQQRLVEVRQEAMSLLARQLGMFQRSPWQISYAFATTKSRYPGYDLVDWIRFLCALLGVDERSIKNALLAENMTSEDGYLMSVKALIEVLKLRNM